MKQGRPVKSEIRSNIAVLLKEMKKAHGYEIYKKYIKKFKIVTLRAIYYQLHKGVQLNIFSVENEKIKGDYSWGNDTIVKKYSLKGEEN
jgi:hypothetical protein